MARIMGPSRHRGDHDERDTAGGICYRLGNHRWNGCCGWLRPGWMVNPEAPTCWPDGLGDIANVGLMLVEAKQLLAHVQQDVGASYAQRARPRTCGEGAPSAGDGSRSAALIRRSTGIGSGALVVTRMSTGLSLVRLTPRARPMICTSCPSAICQRMASAMALGCRSVSAGLNVPSAISETVQNVGVLWTRSAL
jgi:hypothetical protein